MEIHCSALPRIMSCPASLQEPTVRMTGDSPAARLGSAAHEALACVVRGGEHDVPSIAAKWRVEADDLSPLVGMGRQLLAEYADTLDMLHVEHRMSAQVGPDVMLLGTADLLCGVRGEDPRATLIVGDIKTGMEGAREYRDQLLGYCHCAIRDLSLGFDASAIKALTLWVRDRAAVIEDVTPDMLDDWRDRLIHAVSHLDRYHPSATNCQFCPRQNECPARKELVQTAISDMLALDVRANESTNLPAQLATFYDRVKLIRDALDKYDAALKSCLAVAESIPLPDGRELYLQDRVRLTVDDLATVRRIWLGSGHSEADLDAALSVSLPDLKTAIGKSAKRGEKGKVIEAFVSELREAGALRESHSQAVAVRKSAVVEKERT